METIISEFKNIKVYYTGQRKLLPQVYSEKVKKHWDNLISSGKSFFNGDLFTIGRVETNENGTDIFVELTDFAHFIYSKYKDNYEEHDWRGIYTSVLIVTSDNKFAVGIMNDCTSFPNKLQLIGGGLDKNDIKGETLDLEHNIRKEISEELGIDSEDKAIVRSLEPLFIKSGGEDNFLSAIFKMELSMDENELILQLEKHNKNQELKGEMQEVKSIIFIDIDKEAVKEFAATDERMKDGNLVASLEAVVGLRSVFSNKFIDYDGSHCR